MNSRINSQGHIIEFNRAYHYLRARDSIRHYVGSSVGRSVGRLVVWSVGTVFDFSGRFRINAPIQSQATSYAVYLALFETTYRPTDLPTYRPTDNLALGQWDHSDHTSVILSPSNRLTVLLSRCTTNSPIVIEYPPDVPLTFLWWENSFVMSLRCKTCFVRRFFRGIHPLRMYTPCHSGLKLYENDAFNL